MKKSITIIFIFLAMFFAVPNIYAESHINALNETGIYKVKVSGEYDYDNANDMLKIVNQEREKEGLTTLKMDKELTEIAMARAMELSIYLSHTRPNGEYWDTISLRGDEENYAYIYTSAKSAMAGFMASESHKNAILNSERRSVGIACYFSYGKAYWVQIFSSEEVIEEFKSRGSEEKEGVVDVKAENLQVNVFYEGKTDPIRVSKGKTSSPQRIQHINTQHKENSLEINLVSADFIWESSNPEVFTVDANGTITGVSVGSATLSVIIGDQVKEYPVQVTIDLETISLPKEVRIRNGKTETLEATFLPLGSSIPLYSFAEWKSSNPAVATVNSNGVVTSKSNGTTTVTLKIGDIEASTEVIVYESIIGDADGNGIVNSKDIFTTMNLAFKKLNNALESIKMVDINSNGKIDFIDIYYVIYKAMIKK